ncbi:hypothetical protein DL98DRAFT_523011, partial [Cadophora sp. DSE1049]
THIRGKCNSGTPSLLLNVEANEERETGNDPPLGGGDGHNEQVVDLEPLSPPNTGRGNCPKLPFLEEEAWASWKYIVSGKEGNGNSARLRNASWRAWMRSKYYLATVPAENINWLKDCDVTWLSSASYMALSGMESSELDLLLNKKPILKKRSALEVMLQLSLYNSSFLNPLLLRQGPGDEFLPVTPVEQFAVTDVGDYDVEDIEGPPTIEEPVRRNAPIRYSQDDSQITSKTITILPSTTLKFHLQSFEPAADILLNWDEECRDEGAAVVVPGLFSRVAGAVKAAKDIAFFLWSTGYKD